jgi:hypothetical protein
LILFICTIYPSIFLCFYSTLLSLWVYTFFVVLIHNGYYPQQVPAVEAIYERFFESLYLYILTFH